MRKAPDKINTVAINQKNQNVLDLIEALREHKEHKTNELKNLAKEMKMNFDENLYTQIENLESPEIDELTIYLLKWLRDPKIKVYNISTKVLSIFTNFTVDLEKYISFVRTFLNPKKFNLFPNNNYRICLAELRRLIKNRNVNFDKNLSGKINNFNYEDMKKLKEFLRNWLLNYNIDVSCMSSNVLDVFTDFTKYNDFIKYKDFVENLFKRGILDKKYVKNVFRGELSVPQDLEKYKDFRPYQCKPVAGENGQFKGVVFRIPDGIYQISIDKADERSKLVNFFVSLGFEN